MNLSEHFTYEEAIASETASRLGIDNRPSASILTTMCAAAAQLEKVRAILGVPIHINSWYRCPMLNTNLGSKPTSQHLKGEAIDFIAPTFDTPVKVAIELVHHQKEIQFDQLILEHTWIHISFAILSGQPRGNILSLTGHNQYTEGLTNKYGEKYEY